MRNPQENPTERASDAGFSLVELLVVIVIVGILAALVVFAVGGLVDGSEVSACDSDRRVVGTAVESWFAKNEGSTVPATGVGPDRYEQTLVEAGFIRSPSEFLDLANDGKLIPAANSPC